MLYKYSLVSKIRKVTRTRPKDIYKNLTIRVVDQPKLDKANKDCND